jgi:predicted ATP-grasp superfamily ATP-dependent carboligase
MRGGPRRPAHDRASVLLTDGNARGILASARTLAAAGFAVGAVAEAPRAATHWSFSCRERYVAPDPRANPAAFVDALAQIATTRRYTILLPGSDVALWAISRARATLPPAMRLGLPPEPAVGAALDKRCLDGAAHAAGLSQPRTASCATLDEVLEAAESFGYPVMLKPRSTVFAAGGGFLQRSSRIAADELQLRGMAPDYGSPCLVQEHIAGRPYSFAGVLTEDGLAAVAMARYDRTWPPAAGNAAFATTVEPPPWLSDAVRRLLDALGWRGLFELELIDPGDGTFIPIDVNPRPYGSLALASAAGAPLAVLWCRMLLGDSPEPRVARAGHRYRWEDAELRHLLWTVRHDGALAAVRSLRPRRQTVHAYFRWRDPAPLAARALELGTRLPRRLAPGESGSESL